MSEGDLPAEERPDYLERLNIDADADARTIKRAYARELKLINLDTDPAAFQQLREAYDAALFWQRMRVQDQDHAAAANGPVAEPDAPPAALSADLPRAALDQDADEDDPDGGSALAAQAVFAEFEVRCSVLDPADDSQAWHDALAACLSDERLIHIGARLQFEQRVAALLTDGWRPGHHVLLPVATALFEWDTDRQRVQALGMAGYALQIVIAQRAMFDAQEHDVRTPQRELILLLRATASPDANKLLESAPVLATLETRFPDWLAVIVDPDQLTRWHALARGVPRWRRALGAGNQLHRLGIGSVWTLMAGLILMAAFSTFSDDGKPYTPNASNAPVTLAMLDQMIEARPDDAANYAKRALYLSDLGDAQGAVRDLNTLQTLEPDNAELFRGRGVVAFRAGDDKAAIAAFTRVLELDRSNAFSYMWRAYAYRRAGELDKALADADMATSLDPGWPGAYRLRGQIFHARGDRQRMVVEAETLLAREPVASHAYETAARMYQEIDQLDKARALLDRGIVHAPSAEQYLLRAELIDQAEVAQRRSDIAAALQLDPAATLGMSMLVHLEMYDRQYAAAIAAIDLALRHKPVENLRVYLLTSRVIALAKLGNAEGAQAELALAIAAAQSSQQMNTICWELALSNTFLDTALTLCDAALAKGDSWATLDSKGLVLLQLKRYRQALAAYDGALRMKSDIADSLYGRAVVKRRLGDRAGSEADLRAARALWTGIDAYFKHWGIVP